MGDSVIERPSARSQATSRSIIAKILEVVILRPVFAKTRMLEVRVPLLTTLPRISLGSLYTKILGPAVHRPIQTAKARKLERKAEFMLSRHPGGARRRRL